MAGNHEMVELGKRDGNCSASPSSSSVYHSTRLEELLGRKSEYKTALDYEIAASKDHWSELSQPSSVTEDSRDGEEGKARHTNREIVQSLRRQFPQAGDFFGDDGDDFVLGEKIAEGAQAEIFEASWKGISMKFVLKVFKEGSSVLDLQKQWPLGMLNLRKQWPMGMLNRYKFGRVGGMGCSPVLNRYKLGRVGGIGCSPVLLGTVVMNGRFAFVMLRCAGDLRKLIDKKKESNPHSAPFSDLELHLHMLFIARGMRMLHKCNIVHRDLKASNVLLWTRDEHLTDNSFSLPLGSHLCLVADYECSVGVVGTGFWRAPEILQGVKVGKITADLFTKKVDVYSFAMTYYEMITGKLPFEGVPINNYDVVLEGDRPILPEEIEPWIKTLLNRCWHANPKERPSFKKIVKIIKDNVPRLK